MKAATTAELRDALDAFWPLEPQAEELALVRRSDLERWAECPAMAALTEGGKEGPRPDYIEVGEQVHQAISTAIRDWCESDGEIGPVGIRQSLEQALRGSRPDVQPQVIAAARASLWAFGGFLAEIHPANILAFDGGEEIGRSGQLAIDLPTAGVRYTGEVDLLWAGPEKNLLHLEDWKSGWRFFRGYDVANSFQFQSYAVMTFAVYPSIEAVEIRVWNLRNNTRTYPVFLERAKSDQYLARIHAAIQVRRNYRDDPVPWPAAEKCGRCPVALHCPASGDIGEVARDPLAALRQYIALQAKLGELEGLLKRHVKQHGPIQLDSGERFSAEWKTAPKPQLIVPKARTPKVEAEDESNGDG